MTAQLYGPNDGSVDSGTIPNARNSDYSTIVAVAPGATVDIISFTSISQWRARGFNVTGYGDGYVILMVDSIPLLAGRLYAMQKSLHLVLPNPVAVPNGVTVSLKVKNEAEVSCDYEGVVFGL